MVQWNYIGKWDTREKCKNYIEYICSVSQVYLGQDPEFKAGIIF